MEGFEEHLRHDGHNPASIEIPPIAAHQLLSFVEEWPWLDQIPPLPPPQDGPRHAQQPRDAEFVNHDHDHDQQSASNGHMVNQEAQARREELQRVRSIAQHLKETYSRITKLREEVLQLRTQGTHEREESRNRRRHFMESQKKLSGMLLHPEAAQSMHSADGADLQALQRQLEDDDESIAAQDLKVLHLEVDLLQKEFYLRGKEEALAQASNELLDVLGQQYFPDADGSDRSEPLPHVQDYRDATPLPSPPIPAALEDYYEKMGAVGWNEERLVELKSEYRRLRVDRVFKEDQGETLETSAELFEAEYSKKFFNAQQAIEMASAEAEKAKAACQEQGLDPDGHGQQHLREVPDAALLPITPEEQLLGPVVPHKSPTPALGSVLSERNQSSTALTTVTGPLNHDEPPRRRRRREGQRDRNRIQNWIQDNQLKEQFPFEEERFQAFPDTRPIAPSRHSINGSIESLKDWPVVSRDIAEKLPSRLQEHSQSESNIFRRRGGNEQIRPPRSRSESGIGQHSEGKDPQQKNREEIYRDLMSNRWSQESKDPEKHFPEFEGIASIMSFRVEYPLLRLA